MEKNKKVINGFLVNVFNEILKTEEKCISDGNLKDLSVKELHVIEAVCSGCEDGKNSSGDISQALNITAGTLTTAVNILERKGYIYRKKDDFDKRMIRLYSTEKGEKANNIHMQFHVEMVNGVLAALNEDEVDIFVKGLSSITVFFKNKELKKENFND